MDLQPDEVERVSSIANDDGEVTKEEFLAYAKSSDFFKSQGWDSPNILPFYLACLLLLRLCRERAQVKVQGKNKYYFEPVGQRQL